MGIRPGALHASNGTSGQPTATIVHLRRKHHMCLQEWDYMVLTVADPLTRLLELAETVRLIPSVRCSCLLRDRRASLL